MVARDGIEPPTPAFSGPRSTTELSGLGESKGAASALVVSESAASGGRPGQVSNCAQATNVSIAITSQCANFAPADRCHNPAGGMSYTGPSPRFPMELVVSANLMRLSLMKAAHAAMDGATYRKSGSQFTIRIHRSPSRSMPRRLAPICRALHTAASTLLLCLAPAALAQ